MNIFFIKNVSYEAICKQYKMLAVGAAQSLLYQKSVDKIQSLAIFYR